MVDVDHLVGVKHSVNATLPPPPILLHVGISNSVVQSGGVRFEFLKQLYASYHIFLKDLLYS